jgi:hypothetical protein
MTIITFAYTMIAGFTVGVAPEGQDKVILNILCGAFWPIYWAIALGRVLFSNKV